MKILVDRQLLVAAWSGLNAYGKQATAEIADRLKKAIQESSVDADMKISSENAECNS